MLRLRFLTVLGGFWLSLLICYRAHGAAIFYGGSTYTQNFDSLQSDASSVNYTSLPAGWQVSDGRYRFTNGSDGYTEPFRIYAFGGGAGAEDKALGVVGNDGSVNSGVFGAGFLNVTREVFTTFTLSYVVEQWVKSAGNAHDQVVNFEFSLSTSSLTGGGYQNIPALDMHSINDGIGFDRPREVLDGNAEANRQQITATVSGLRWQPGQTLWIRWKGKTSVFNYTHALAVDDLAFSAAVPEPSAALSIVIGALALATIRRRQAPVRSNTPSASANTLR